MSGPRRPTVSVILPVYGRLDTLERAARTVLDQEGGHLLELLIVDDGSPQDPAPVVAALGDPRVRLLRHAANRGAAAARNTGLAAASGELIAFQDSDDEWLPGKLAAQVAALAAPEATDAAFCYTDMERLTDPAGPAEHYPAPDVQARVLIDEHRGTYASQDIGLQSSMVRQAAIKEAGLFREDLRRFIDLEWFLRLLRVGAGIRIPTPYVRYHLYGEGISFNRAAAAESRIQLLATYSKEASTRFLAGQHLLVGKLLVQTRRGREGMAHLTKAAALRPWWLLRIGRTAIGALMARHPKEEDA